MEGGIKIPAFVIENGERAHREYLRKQQLQMELNTKRAKFVKTLNTITEVIFSCIVFGLMALGVVYCITMIAPAWAETPAATKWVVVFSLVVAIITVTIDLLSAKRDE